MILHNLLEPFNLCGKFDNYAVAISKGPQVLNCITVRLASMYIKCKTRTSVNQILYKSYILSYIKSKIKRVCELTSFPVVICNQICNTCISSFYKQ